MSHHSSHSYHTKHNETWVTSSVQRDICRFIVQRLPRYSTDTQQKIVIFKVGRVNMQQVETLGIPHDRRCSRSEWGCGGETATATAAALSAASGAGAAPLRTARAATAAAAASSAHGTARCHLIVRVWWCVIVWRQRWVSAGGRWEGEERGQLHSTTPHLHYSSPSYLLANCRPLQDYKPLGLLLIN